MNTLINTIPRLGETKSKPKIGEIRLTTDGQRRKVFDGKCWQYLCAGDRNCSVQAKSTCRSHRNVKIPFEASPEKVSTDHVDQLQSGQMQSLPNGNRRIWRGTRWHSLCRADNCLVQAKEFCKTHQNQRISLPTSSKTNSDSVRLTARTRSCTLTSEKSEKVEQQQAIDSQDAISPELPSKKRRRRPDHNTFETVPTLPLEKRELHTRNGRRVRCNGLIWKHLCADKKNPFYKRKYQRQRIPCEKVDVINKIDENQSNELPSISSDTIDSTVQSSPITQMKNSKKRKTTGDINTREHIVPKTKTNGSRRKGSDKPIILHLEPNSPNASVSDVSSKDQIIDEPAFEDSEISFSLKPNRLNTSYQSIEIPVQPSTPFTYDSSPAAILEQFGTIIKKEAVIEEESLVCVPATYSNEMESPCETLQDFLRAEEMKKKEFKLDCQRISYRLAKIQDCIGSISSITS